MKKDNICVETTLKMHPLQFYLMVRESLCTLLDKSAITRIAHL